MLRLYITHSSCRRSSYDDVIITRGDTALRPSYPDVCVCSMTFRLTIDFWAYPITCCVPLSPTLCAPDSRPLLLAVTALVVLDRAAGCGRYSSECVAMAADVAGNPESSRAFCFRARQKNMVDKNRCRRTQEENDSIWMFFTSKMCHFTGAMSA